jgi:hypothetical protein
MGILKDAGDSILKYSEKLVNKTEEYAKIGKLTLDIKKHEGDIDKANREIGELVMEKISSGAASIDVNDVILKNLSEKIKSIRLEIDQKKKMIEDVKSVAGGSPKAGS